MEGRCPGCDEEGPVGEPCSEKACHKRGYRFIPTDHFERVRRRSEQTGQNPDPLVGQLIGDFLVVDILGAGGFGKVYLTLQEPLFRLRGAMKVLDFPTNDRDFADALLQKFQREAEVLAELSHPNIVRLLKYGIHRGRPYLVMEYLDEGVTLRDEIYARAQKDAAFDQEELGRIVGQLLNGLETAHERSIIHRDLKPENIMLQEVVGNPYHVRILDFGIAKFVETRTDTKWPLGSPSYMAPEQASLQNLGTWTDMYALGVIFFELVTGRRPYPGDSEDTIMSRKLDDSFDPFERVEDLQIPEPTLELMRRAIAREPDDRIQTVDEFRTRLGPALEAMVERPDTIGPGGEALTFLLDSGDIVELDESTAGDDDSDASAVSQSVTRSADDSPPPDLPEPADAPTPPNDEEAPETDAAESTARSRWPTIAAIAAGLLVLAGLWSSDTLGGLLGGSPPADDATPTAATGDEGSADPAAAATAGDATGTDATTGGADAGETGDTRQGALADTADATDASDTKDGGDTDAGAPLPDEAVVELSAGKHHTCALRADGRTHCWGDNAYGQLGLGHTRAIGDDEPAGAVAPLDLGGPARQIAAAGDRRSSFTCALIEGGTVRCWGDNAHGQLGVGHTQNIGNDESLDALQDVPLGGRATAIAAGASEFGSHACALLAGGELRCWGKAKFGKLGLGHTSIVGDNETPEMVGTVPVGAPVAQVAAGKYNTCAVTEDRGLRCWGWNKHGQLGLGHTDDIGDDELPRSSDPAELGGPVEQVSVGRRHVCAVIEGGAVRCWGWNKYGQLGLGHTDSIGDNESPAETEPIPLEGPVRQVTAGSLHSCALLKDGSVQCWGDNRFGQLGLGHQRNLGDDESVAGAGTVYLGAPALALATGRFHNCALLEDRSVRCWGLNARGELGLGHTNDIGDDEPPGSVAPVPLK